MLIDYPKGWPHLLRYNHDYDHQQEQRPQHKKERERELKFYLFIYSHVLNISTEALVAIHLG